MNDFEDSSSSDWTDSLRVCRFLDQCTLLLEPSGRSSCDFALRYNHNTEEIYTGADELSGSDVSSPEPIATSEEIAEPGIPPSSLIDE
ncbi:MAG: hypothetical protein ABSF28_22655 [Terracidiphilus sp.]|jgi:hypothetical protein